MSLRALSRALPDKSLTRKGYSRRLESPMSDQALRACCAADAEYGVGSFSSLAHNVHRVALYGLSTLRRDP